MSGKAPDVEPRKMEDYFAAVQKKAPFYVPEWRMEDKDASFALWKVFAHLIAGVARRLNRVPDKNLLAFLEKIGVSLLPPQPARAPLTFVLSGGAAESVPVPERTQAAAGDVVFETEQAITATPARLAVVYGVDNLSDVIVAPPPGFLTSDEPTAFATTLACAAGAGDQGLFLTDTGGLSAGDLLVLGGREWVLVAGLDGTIATLDDKLSFSHAAGTAVEKALEFELFRGRNEQEHIFYFGHHDLFNLKKGTGRGHVLIKLGLTGTNAWLDADLNNLKNITWEYWGEEGETGADQWLPFKVYRVKRSADSPLTAEVWLWKKCGRQTKERDVAGIRGRWLRASAAPKEIGVPPLVRITAAVNNLNGPDMAFNNDVPVNLKASFYPFGKTPRQNDVFYLASQECFSKKGEPLNIEFELTADNDPRPEDLLLSWEYWNGQGWQAVKGLSGHLKDGKKVKYQFQGDGGVSFTCPVDFAPVEVNGQKNYWLRVRILNGGYGLESVIEFEKKIYRSLTEVRPPLVKAVKMKLKASYRRELDSAISYNELAYRPLTAASKGEGGPFQLFFPPADTHPALYLGFDRALGKGPVSVFFAVYEVVCEAAQVPRLVWEYFRDNGVQGEWTRLDVVDSTQGMTRSGTVEFVPPAGMIAQNKFGRDLYYLRAVDVNNKLRPAPRRSISGDSRSVRGWSLYGKTTAYGALQPEGIRQYIVWEKQADFEAPRLKGIYPNTTWVKQVETVKDEIIGSSTGLAGQSFTLLRSPVLEEEVSVKEAGSIVTLEQPVLNGSLSGVSAGIVESMDGKSKESWVRWQAVDDYSGSGPGSRHYVVDRTTGAILFGDGQRGMIPPAGQNNLKITYRTGGGSRGNVDKGAINSLRTALAFVDKVKNPQPAGGGSAAESYTRVLERGPALLKHRDRAVTPEDFEQLAKEASQGVARARCLPNFNPGAEIVPGWVTVLVVPAGAGAKPELNPLMKKQVEDYLKDRMPCTVLAGGRLQVRGPVYVELTVRAKIITRSMAEVSALENLAFERVNGYLHPLTGGSAGKGWQFGEAPCAGDFFKLLEELDGADYVDSLSLLVKTGTAPEVEVDTAKTAVLDIPSYALVCSSGRHDLKIEFKER
ncbi:Baseplate J-like protein [Pelotomaculum sp. FP]|uniref:putative baseplate assembly protein n=1 Tax=Pelotomaculum sp. FP TaxID=261474 RepID=UPI001065DDF3|nr:putative baseplate assembly protein [Pelotomaculum sp. FP]TEB15326.1 Baseplate J-like protein [Pelotomaculum sp. FP]